MNVGIRLHNKVPINVKKLEEYKPYRRELKTFLIDHALCSVEEFFNNNNNNNNNNPHQPRCAVVQLEVPVTHFPAHKTVRAY